MSAQSIEISQRGILQSTAIKLQAIFPCVLFPGQEKIAEDIAVFNRVIIA